MQQESRSAEPRFVVFEGIDGSGTTTQTRRLAHTLKQSGERVYATCEPTDSVIGKLIRRILAGDETVEPHTMAHLFAADRSEHVRNTESGIRHYLNDGAWVISDRYVFSSLAYQGPLIGFDTVKQLNDNIPLPLWVFHLALPSGEAMQRLAERKSLDIYENTTFQDTVSRAYTQAYAQYDLPDCRWVTLDGSKAPETIHREICTILGILPIE